MMDEDLSLTMTQKAPARKGRRAAPSIPTSNSFDTTGSTEDLDSSSPGPLSPSKNKGPIAPPRSRRTGGWADETLKSAKSKHKIQDPAEIERFRSPEGKKPDSDDDIPVIPDLDDLQEDDVAPQIARAPTVIVNRVATYKELDSDLFKHAAFATLDDMNLRLLTKRLNLEADVKEPDSCWSWDLLFTDVASDLNNELDKN